MKIEQEPKYDAVDGRIVNRASGEAIPDDEPVFIFRARDRHALEAIRRYSYTVSDPAHRDAIRLRMRDFENFWDDHPERMKEPDTASPSERGVE